MRPSWRLLLLPTFLLSILAALPSASASVEDPATLDDLIAAFEVGDVPADFVVVVDTSRSMLERGEGRLSPYEGVLQAYRQFVGSVGEGNRLAVVTFGAGPRLTFDAKISAANRATALAAIPSADPANFRGPQHGSTDIGAALSETLKRLESPDSSEVQTVIFLTDGRHAPPDSSRYQGARGPAWDQLTARGRTLAGSRILDVYGAGIGASGSTDVSLVGRVFPDPSVLDVPPDQLGPIFDSAVKRSQALRVQGPLQRELEAGAVQASVPDPPDLAAGATFEIRLESTLDVLPLDLALEGVAVQVEGQPVEAELTGGPRVLRLPPGGSETVEVRAVLPVQDSRFQVPAQEQSAAVQFAVSGTATARPSELIDRLYGLDSAVPLAQPEPVRVGRTIGYTYLQVLVAAALLALALLLLALFLRWLLVPPPLIGYLVVRDRPGGEQSPVRLSGRRMEVGPRQLPEGGGAAVELFTRPRKRKQVFAQVKKGDFEYQERGWRTVLGERRLSFADVYKLGGARFVWVASKPGSD